MTRPTGRGDLEPLFGLRLRAPRLELRLGTVEELGRLAEHGVRPPEEMPFAVPWTDASGAAGFLEGFLDDTAPCSRPGRRRPGPCPPLLDARGLSAAAPAPS